MVEWIRGARGDLGGRAELGAGGVDCGGQDCCLIIFIYNSCSYLPARSVPGDGLRRSSSALPAKDLAGFQRSLLRLSRRYALQLTSTSSVRNLLEKTDQLRVRWSRSKANAPLCALGLLEWCRVAHSVAQQTSVCNHDAVVDAESGERLGSVDEEERKRADLPLVCCEDAPSSFPCHDAHHLLQPGVACRSLSDYSSDTEPGRTYSPHHRRSEPPSPLHAPLPSP